MQDKGKYRKVGFLYLDTSVINVIIIDLLIELCTLAIKVITLLTDRVTLETECHSIVDNIAQAVFTNRKVTREASPYRQSRGKDRGSALCMYSLLRKS